MLQKPLYTLDYGAGMRISAESRKRNKEAYEEFMANFEKISEGLRAWEIALKRSTQFLEAFEDVR